MDDIYLLSGGNIGNRLQNLEEAANLIQKTAGTVKKKSSVYETAPWGFTNQETFLNQVICISSKLDPTALLHQLLAIEIELGRKRVEKMGPRLIDIDILFYGNHVIFEKNLIVPHPRIVERRFVLTPLNEIAPDLVHPVYNKTVNNLMHACTDLLEVKIYKEIS